MKNSQLIGVGYPFAKVFARSYGVSADCAGTPMLIAWALEEAALRSGWQEGSHLGTESDLIRQLGVSRDTLREAVRVIEARGSMQMQRGRAGGLRLLRPYLDDVAAALATYLQASGCTEAELAETAAIANPVFAVLDEDDLVVRLYHRTVSLFFAGTISGMRHMGRAGIVAARLARCQGPIPEHGIYLGDEAELCEKLGCTRPALREALRMIGDLSMLKVRRGRGGGFSLVRPSPDGTIRQLFGLIASRHQTLREIVPAVAALNLIRFRLAILQWRRMDQPSRKFHCDELASLLADSREPERWFALQMMFDKIAGSKMISALADSLMLYHARLGPCTNMRFGEIARPLGLAAEALVHALRRCDYAQAEQLHLTIHSEISRMLDCPELPRVEHAC